MEPLTLGAIIALATVLVLFSGVSVAVGLLIRGGLVLLATAAVLTLLVLPRRGFDRPAAAPPKNMTGVANNAGSYDNRQLPAETVGLLAKKKRLLFVEEAIEEHIEVAVLG